MDVAKIKIEFGEMKTDDSGRVNCFMPELAGEYMVTMTSFPFDWESAENELLFGAHKLIKDARLRMEGGE